jgi:hypothetical protein
MSIIRSDYLDAQPHDRVRFREEPDEEEEEEEKEKKDEGETEEGDVDVIGISPRRIPRVTASVRVEAPSLSRIELMWNLTVCSEIPRRAAISLLTAPSANILRTSVSREVISSDNSSATSSALDLIRNRGFAKVGRPFGASGRNHP